MTKKVESSEEPQCASNYTPSCTKDASGHSQGYCMYAQCSDNNKETCSPETGCHWDGTSCVVNQWNPETYTCDTHCPKGYVFNCGCWGSSDVVYSRNECVNNGGLWSEYCTLESAANQTTCNCDTSLPTCPTYQVYSNACTNPLITDYNTCLAQGEMWQMFCEPEDGCKYRTYEVCSITPGCSWTGNSCIINTKYVDNCTTNTNTAVSSSQAGACESYTMSENCERAPENCVWKTDSRGVGYCEDA